MKGSDVPSGSYCENESKMKMCSECIFHGGLECCSFHPYAGKKGRENVGCIHCFFFVGWYMDISNSVHLFPCVCCVGCQSVLSFGILVCLKTTVCGILNACPEALVMKHTFGSLSSCFLTLQSTVLSHLWVDIV